MPFNTAYHVTYHVTILPQGHNLSSLELEVLQHRMAACKVPQWSRTGRLKRREMPKVSVVGVCVQVNVVCV